MRTICVCNDYLLFMRISPKKHRFESLGGSVSGYYLVSGTIEHQLLSSFKLQQSNSF